MTTTLLPVNLALLCDGGERVTGNAKSFCAQFEGSEEARPLIAKGLIYNRSNDCEEQRSEIGRFAKGARLWLQRYKKAKLQAFRGRSGFGDELKHSSRAGLFTT